MQSLEFLFVIALILYSVVIWTHKFKKRLDLWMISVFGGALLIDTIATIIVCVAVSSSWLWNIHTITGLASLLIMAIHFAWAYGALQFHGELEKYFNRYSLYAWSLWLVAFITGIPYNA
jgi:uncharacterized repeat protein (TIGR03987 family)